MSGYAAGFKSPATKTKIIGETPNEQGQTKASLALFYIPFKHA